jgi:hypothetical protein
LGEQEEKRCVCNDPHIQNGPRLMTFSTVDFYCVNHVSDNATHNRLRHLSRCHAHGYPFWATESECTQSEIGVHNRMDAIVHPTEPTSGCGQLPRREPSEDQCGRVMVPMQETDRLLLQYQKYGIHVFERLRKDERRDPKTKYGILNVASDADGVFESVPGPHPK